MTQIFNLQARQHQSRVLMSHLAGRPGALERAGLAIRNDSMSVSSSDAAGMEALFAPLRSASGFSVTDKTAMTVSTVYACMTKIAGAILQLPVHQYRIDARGERDRMAKTPLWWMLNEQPHVDWTAASWKEWIVRCWGLRGDQVTEIVRSTADATRGVPIALKPLHPDCVAIKRDAEGALVYDVYDPYTKEGKRLHRDDVLHFAGFGFDGTSSLSVVQWAARNAVGNALAGADYMGRTVGEGAMPQIALSYPNRIGPEQQTLLRNSFVATYTGTASRKVPLVLTEGGSATPLSISPVDMQLIESRRFEKEDICQAFGVPPVMIGENEKTSSWGTGVEQITLGFVRFTLAPMLCRWEEELNRKLFRRAGQFIEFSLAALLRGDSKAQAEAFRAALGGPGSGDGWMSVDEVRKLTNQPALGGDFAEPYRAQRAADASPAADQAAALELRRVEAVERSSQADLLRAQTPPVINIQQPDIHITQPAISVNMPEVRVDAPVVNISPPVVNVAAPEVSVEALMPTNEPPVINVASTPAPVLVVNEVKPADVSISLPDRERTTTVERDHRGDIVRTVTIETDA